jgi:hypothetical protein
MRPQKVRNSCISSGKKRNARAREREGLNYDSPGASRVYPGTFYPRDYLSISFSARLSSGMHVPVQKSINLHSKLFIGISFKPLCSPDWYKRRCSGHAIARRHALLFWNNGYCSLHGSEIIFTQLIWVTKFKWKLFRSLIIAKNYGFDDPNF